MSYDLYFWREEHPSSTSPDEMLERLSAETKVEDVAAFPNDAVIAEFQKEFPDIRFETQQLVWEGLDTGFEVNFSHPDDDHIHLITATCGYSLLNHSEILNRVIDVAHRFGCGVYDPQVPRRYPEPDHLQAQ